MDIKPSSSLFNNSLGDFIVKKINTPNFQGLITYAGGTSIAQALMMVYALLLARWLGPDDYGYFTTGYSITTLSAFLINWGMDTWLLRRGAIGTDPRTWVGFILKTKLILYLIWAPLLVTSITYFRPGLLQPIFLAICTVDIWIDSSFTTIISGLNIKQKYQQIAILLFLSRAGRIIGLLILILIGQNAPLLFGIFRSIATIFSLVAAMLVFRPLYNKPDQFSNIPQLTRELAPFSVSDFFAIIYLMVDVSILAFIKGQQEVGLYAPAVGLVNALFIIPNTFYLAYIPILTGRMNSDIPLPIGSLWKFMIIFSGTGVLLSVGVAITSHFVVQFVLGTSYIETGNLLFILSPILLFKSLQFGIVGIIVAAGWQKRRLLPQGIAALINLIFNLLLIPKLGAFGSAIAYNISEITLLIGYSILLFFWAKSYFKNLFVRK